MDRTYWHKQTTDQPLFPDLIWSRPESKRSRGKLLVIGGNAHGFSAPAEAFAAAEQAGIGTARVLLPDSLKKTVGRVFVAGEYAPSTPSGSFAHNALGELLAQAEWADNVLLAGDFGKNSETAILLEEFIFKYGGQITITGDSLDYFLASPAPLLNRASTTLVLDLSQLQKVGSGAKLTFPFTHQMDFLHLVDALHGFTKNLPANIVLVHEQKVFVASGGRVSTTKNSSGRLLIAASASVWWLQNPTKTFEALTSAPAEK